MKYSHFVLAGLLFCVPMTQTWSATPKANAALVDSKGTKIGEAKLKETKEGVKISLKISGLAAGHHAFHIHETGICAAPDFKSAGGHFNPFHKHHGLQNKKGAHAGDLADLVVSKNGKGKVTVVASQVTLKDGKNSLFHKGGTAIVIHAAADDNKSDPAGNAGARVACGVIKK